MSLDISLTVKADTGNSETENIEVYSANITHNLSSMAQAVGVYDATWGAYGKDASTSMIPVVIAIQRLKDDPARYDEYSASNEWGTRDQFIAFLSRFLTACEMHPNATIHTSS
jgi:hypothetical protein